MKIRFTTEKGYDRFGIPEDYPIIEFTQANGTRHILEGGIWGLLFVIGNIILITILIVKSLME